MSGSTPSGPDGLGRSQGARPRVKVLPDHVANQIAAGEVVERPASVVKELVENALDAGARTVRVSVEQGGKGRIRVADDGCGMVREDVLACLDRHATSKIRDAKDLMAIGTLGFRGEALPSIAAVSRMVIETAAEGDDAGTRVRALAGRIQSVEDAARRPGTTVDVRNLFLNTPVRARFLRNVGLETRAVAETLHALALANLDVRFVFETNGRPHLDLAAGRPLEARIGEIWEDAGLLPLSARREGLGLDGAVQRPDRARSGFRRAQLFVNGRPFRDRRVVAAADRGYRTTVAEGVRAWVFLFLTVPPDQVDVNVHPGKAEVRFQDLAAVEDFVEASVRKVLEGIDSAATWGKPPPVQMVREGPSGGRGPGGRGSGGRGSGGRGSGWGGSDRDRRQIRLFRETDTVPEVPGPGGSPTPQGGSPTPGPGAPEAGGPGGSPTPGLGIPDSPGQGGPDTPGSGGIPGAAVAAHAPKPALLQVHNSFILAETRDGVIIIDQHAAHERILYERIMARFEAGAEGQRLLFPFTVRLGRAELDVVRSASGLLAKTGFQVEPFGADAVLVHAVPSPHPHFDAERCIREMLHELAQGSDLMRAARNQNERVAMSFACKGAIKAGQRLTSEEMQDLFDQLFATELPYHDVHGRPTVVRLGLDELRRKFGRS